MFTLQLNQTYLILSRSKDNSLNRQIGDFMTHKTIEKGGLLLSPSLTNVHTYETPATMDTNHSAEELSLQDATSSSAPRPFSISQEDVVLEWKEGMAQVLLRMVRNQQRGSCGEDVWSGCGWLLSSKSLGGFVVFVKNDWTNWRYYEKCCFEKFKNPDKNNDEARKIVEKLKKITYLYVCVYIRKRFVRK